MYRGLSRLRFNRERVPLIVLHRGKINWNATAACTRLEICRTIKTRGGSVELSCSPIGICNNCCRQTIRHPAALDEATVRARTFPDPVFISRRLSLFIFRVCPSSVVAVPIKQAARRDRLDCRARKIHGCGPRVPSSGPSCKSPTLSTAAREYVFRFKEASEEPGRTGASVQENRRYLWLL